MSDNCDDSIDTGRSYIYGLETGDRQYIIETIACINGREDDFNCKYNRNTLYAMRTPLSNPDLALREAEVALRLFGHGGICVAAKGLHNNPAILDRLAALCRRSGAVLMITRTAE